MIDIDSWQRPNVFAWLQQAGNISEQEMLTTFNCGIGMLLIVSPDDVEATLESLRSQGEAPTLKSVKLLPATTLPMPGRF